MDLFDAIRRRRSIRRFRPDPVPQALLEQIVDAGRLAPTAHNDQPWEFVVVTSPGTRRQIAEITDYGKFIADAPACVVVLSRPTRHAVEDGSAATANMLLAATGLGLGSCWVAGYTKAYAAKIAALCGAPGDLVLISMIAIGYPDESPAPSKRSLDDVLHWEVLGRKHR